ncbi:hypothetical protein [Nocardia sp. NPDC004711]
MATWTYRRDLEKPARLRFRSVMDAMIRGTESRVTAESEKIIEQHRVTEEMAASLTEALGNINKFGDFLCGESVPRPGSEYAAESGFLTDVQTWSSAVEAGLSALDHLYYFADTTVKAGRVTAFASFTVLRSAIASVALAGWLVEGDQKQRLTRTLALRRLEDNNQIAALDEIVDAPRPRQGVESDHVRKRREQAASRRADMVAIQDSIDSDATKLRIDVSEVKKMPRDGVLLAVAAKLVKPATYYDFGADRESLLNWRILSSYAHGQTWAANMSAQVTLGNDGVRRTQWAPDKQFLMQGFQVAWNLMYGPFDRYVDLAGAR